MSRPPRSGGGGGGGGGGAGGNQWSASRGRPKRRAAATHFFKYQLASNPSRAEENDLKRALQESLEEQQQHHHNQQSNPQQHKDASNHKRQPTRLISSTNSSDVSRSNNSSSSSNQSNGSARQPHANSATRATKTLKRDRASQLAEHEQPSKKRTKQTTSANSSISPTTSNGHSTDRSNKLLEDEPSRVTPSQTSLMACASGQLVSSRGLIPASSITVHGKATQTMPANCTRAIRTYSRIEPQLTKTPQQFNVINDLIVVRSSTPKSSNTGFSQGPTTAILVSPFPQPQTSEQPPSTIQVDCIKPTKNGSKSGNNHHQNRTINNTSTNQPTTITSTTTAAASNNNNHRKQTRTAQQQQVSQSAKCGSVQRTELDLHNNESNARASKVARCLIFNTMDLSLKPATFAPRQTQHQASSKLNDSSTSGADTGAAKSSDGSWSLLGVPEEKVIYLKDDEPPKRLICYPAIKHVEGDVIQVKDSVLLRSGARKTDLPYIAKVCSFWKNSETGGVMMSLLWYYRPEHTEEGRKAHNLPDEIFASRHRDVDSVECIEDKCYVLTFNEYCRYKKRCKMEQVNTTWSLADVTIPVSNESYPRRTRIPDCDVSSELVFCCRQIYDSRTKRLIKNPLISPKYGNI